MIARNRMGSLIAIAVMLLSGTQARGDHPLHATRATIEFNAETSSFEVALCVFPDDLSQALSAHAGHKILVESVADVDGILSDYIQGHFQLRLNAEPPRKMQWLGHEFETQQAWLYFEFPVDGDSPTEVRLKNSILMDQFDDQINVAYVRIGDRQRCISFRTDTAPWQPWKVSRDNASTTSLPRPTESID